MGSDNTGFNAAVHTLRQIGDRVHSPMPIQRWNCDNCGAKSQGSMCSYCGHVTTPAVKVPTSAKELFARADEIAKQIKAHGGVERAEAFAALQMEDPVMHAVVKSRL